MSLEILKNLRFYFIAIMVLVGIKAYGQSPNADFFFEDNACLGANVPLQNLSTNAYSYKWDFCFIDLSAAPTVSDFITIPETNTPVSISIVYDSANWYGFLSSRDNHKLFRLNFGQSLENIPTYTDLGSNQLNRPYNQRFIKENGKWYGLLINSGNGSLVRLTYNQGINNPQVATNIGNLSSWITLRGLDLVQDNGTLKAIVSSAGNHKLTILDFGSSILNNPSGAGILDIGVGNSLISNPLGIKLIKDGDNWYGILASHGNGKILKLSFGNNLFSQPVIEQIHSVSGPTEVVIEQEGFDYTVFVATSGGSLIRLKFGNSMNNVPQVNNLGSLGVLGNTFALDLVKDGTGYKAFTVNYIAKTIQRLEFESNCAESVSKPVSYSKTPEDVYYKQPGNYFIELIATNENNMSSELTKMITVNDQTAPSLSILYHNVCLSSTNTFEAVIDYASKIVSHTWEIDQLTTLHGPEISYQFPSSGQFNISLEVRATNGCYQRTSKPITIYPEPIPSFAIHPSTLCSNTELPFTNTSQTFGADDVIQWQWDFNEEGASSQRDPAFNFSQGGAKMVSLTATIPGCAPKTTQWFNVTAGPEVQFSVQNQCFGKELQFINQSSGEGITQHHWLLGNGQTSFDLAPSLVYDTAGTYPVQLEVTNAMGCTNVLEKNILVHFNPVADMEYGLLCSSGTQFIDKSTVNRANLTNWEWSILQDGQYQLLSNEKNPMIETGTAGIHRLKLNVASNFGCSNSKEVEIDALPGPEADFATSAICVGDSVLFTDLSVSLQNNPVTQWYWNINGKGFFTQQPKSLFQTPGAYQVSLKVDAQNLCSDMITKTVVVPRLPVPVFTTSKLCQNEHILFTDKSFSPDDPVKSWEWDFAGLATKTGPQAQFQFPTAKDHAVKLSVVTENGCRQFMVNTVTINPAPKAKFSLYPAVGTVPLPVTLENQSTGAVDYRWSFGEHADSVVTDFQPDYTYQSLGEHEIKLLAISDKGCRDSVTQMISIRLPLLDVELERILKVVNNGELQLVTRINNLGSLIIQDMDLVIDLGSIKLRESFPEILEAGEGVNHPLNFRISDFLEQGLEYVCITLEPRMPGNQEVSLENNKMCISLNELFSILEPFPNPANTELNISYIATNTSDGVSMLVADLTGRVVLDKKVQPQQTGMNHHLLDVRGLSGGMYVIKIAVNDKVIVRRVLVER